MVYQLVPAGQHDPKDVSQDLTNSRSSAVSRTGDLHQAGSGLKCEQEFGRRGYPAVWCVQPSSDQRAVNGSIVVHKHAQLCQPPSPWVGDPLAADIRTQLVASRIVFAVAVHGLVRVVRNMAMVSNHGDCTCDPALYHASCIRPVPNGSRDNR